MIERPPSLLPSLTPVVISPSLFPFLITSWLVSKATSLVNRFLLFYTLTRTTRRISDSGVTRYAIRSRSEEGINSPNECKLPRSRGKEQARARARDANDDAGKNPAGEETHTITSGDDVYIPREERAEPNANEQDERG